MNLSTVALICFTLSNSPGDTCIPAPGLLVHPVTHRRYSKTFTEALHHVAELSQLRHAETPAAAESYRQALNWRRPAEVLVNLGAVYNRRSD